MLRFSAGLLTVLVSLAAAPEGEPAKKPEAAAPVPPAAAMPMFPEAGTLLVSELGAGVVSEIDSKGAVVWKKEGLTRPHKAARIAGGVTVVTVKEGIRALKPDGSTLWERPREAIVKDVEAGADVKGAGRVLFCEPNAKRVTVLDADGKELWKKEGLEGPIDADFLPNGNILVVEQRGERIVEWDAEGKEAWKAEELGRVVCAARLPDGRTLAALETKVVEIDKAGKVARDVATGFSSLRDLDAIPGGRLLVTDQKAGRVAVLAPDGKVLWEKKDLENPVDADWIPPASSSVPPGAPKTEPGASAPPAKEPPANILPAGPPAPATEPPPAEAPPAAPAPKP